MMLRVVPPFKRLIDRSQHLQQRWQNLRWYHVASQLLNRMTSRQHFELTADLRYGEHARHCFDLYRARQPAANKKLIVFVHGGAWQHGSKDDYVFLADTLCKAGHDVAILNYRLSPEVIFPAYVDDLDTALQYLFAQREALQLPEAWVLMGHSAGAFNVMSLLYPPTPYGYAYHRCIQAVIGLAGPYHFDYKGDALAEPAFDASVPYQQVMPKYWVKPNQVQHLLLVAEKDEVVGEFNAVDMAAALQAQGNAVQLQYVPKVSHLMIIASLAAWVRQRYATQKMIVDFLTQLPKAN